MFVHRSNSLEELVDHLQAIVSGPGLGILQPETILIQSAGMERYLSRELARRSGITANVRFPFPRSFFHEVLDRALGKEDSAHAFDRESMTWALFSNLSHHVRTEERAFEPVRSYLADDGDHSKRLLLAERLAHLFDQYVTYRPRMVLLWEQGADADDFQAILWRELIAQFGSMHFAARCNAFMNELSDEQLKEALPPRLSLMGGPGLPPLFLQMIGRIGQVVPAHVFSFSICEEYFADAHPLDDPLPDVGEGLHPLLISLGKVGADYQHLLEMIGDYQEGPAQFRPAKASTVLGALQQSLVEGRRELVGADKVRAALQKGARQDDSITVDSCHSPLREVEVLHDRLLSWFAGDPTLRAEDVVVLAPNIEEYSPLISAVFSARAGERPHIPFRIADRSEKHTNAAARAFLLALSVLRGRVKASEVLDLLQLSPVRARYGIEGPDLERIGRWVHEAGIRWGIDGEHRAEFGLPNDDANTWRFGLRRMLLGYALPDDGAQLWEGTVPLDQIAVADLDLVGRLCDFCENLFHLRLRLERAGEPGLSPAAWVSFLGDLVDVVLADGSDEEWDTGAVRKAVHQIGERAERILSIQQGEATPARLGVRGLAHLLEAELDASRPSTDFLAGGVTFCALLPLRTIPFRAVCVLGLNQGEFPRTDSHHQLDLMAWSPKRGDRSLRADDRYLFLEVILAARERLSLSYVGRSVQDNTEKPPSVVLSELGAVVDDFVRLKSADGTPRSFLEPRAHPLQPFHPDYFRESAPGLTSFDQNAYQGARALVTEPQEVRAFFSANAASVTSDEAEVELSLDQLVRFWKDPTKAFLEARGVRIADDITEVEDREPVMETGLSRYIVGDRVLGQKFRGEAIRDDVELARGELPVGQGGRVLLDNVTDVADEIFRASEAYRAAGSSVPVSLAVECEAEASELQKWLVGDRKFPRVVLTGSVDQLYGGVRLETSYGQLKASRKIALWVRHVAACATGMGLTQSVLVVRANPRDAEGVQTLALGAVPQEKAQELLGELCRLAIAGLSLPLRFYPSASDAYFEALHHVSRRVPEEEVVPRAYQEARKVLYPKNAGFNPDAAISELYRGEDPLGDLDAAGKLAVDVDDLAELPFARLAELIFHPLGQAVQGGDS